MTSYPNLLATAFLSVALLAGSCGNKEDASKAKGGRPNKLTAEGYIVNHTTFNSSYAASGSLLPNEELEIHPEISGRVTAIVFKEGSKVRKGQTLVQLYDGDIRASIQKLRAQKQLQVKILERQKELLNIGGISKQDYETTETQISSIEADIAFSEAQLRSTKIVAPFDGTIGIRNISVGAVVSPTTLITTLQQIHPLKMDFTIPEQYSASIATGKDVFFTVTGSQDTLLGKVAAIDPGANVATRTVRVRAMVPNPDGKLVAGSFANVVVPLQSAPNAILIPSQSVIPTTKDKKVAVVKNGKADMVVVKLGQRTSDKVEVLQGLQAGDTIITTGLMQVKPGMDVTIKKIGS